MAMPVPAEPGVADPQRIRFALHGGAGDLPKNAGPLDEQRAVLRRAAESAQQLLTAGGGALDAVALAVTQLEDCPLFNAGRGAVLNRDGLPEHDAAIMLGADRRCGAIAGTSRVRNPVLLARAVMEQTPHVLFAGAGAERIAAELGLAMVEPEYFVTVERVAQLQAARRTGAIELDHDRAFGTVGAVARDAYGRLAAATSTGGLTNKMPGRVGDTPVIGAGTFADDRSAAVSCTGTGEAFLRAGFGHAVHARLAWCGWELDAACVEALATVAEYGGRGGCIAVDRHGNLLLPFNSSTMFRAWCVGSGPVLVAVGRPPDGN
jgi:beta-aspartyl-peptidase (threonine type)